ncbi:MAG: hypothetical protein PHS30_01575 [Bacteroidales bacterium]|nr:hypothetical protein [Bacteroidales bacterium]
MQHITSTVKLKEAIQQLEVECEFDGLQLKEDSRYAGIILKPLDFIRVVLDKTASPLLIIDKIVGITLKLATIYLTKKIVIGKSGNKFRLLASSVFQFSILYLIAQHKEEIKSIGQFLIHSLLHKKNAKNRD